MFDLHCPVLLLEPGCAIEVSISYGGTLASGLKAFTQAAGQYIVIRQYHMNMAFPFTTRHALLQNSSRLVSSLLHPSSNLPTNRQQPARALPLHRSAPLLIIASIASETQQSLAMVVH